MEPIFLPELIKEELPNSKLSKVDQEKEFITKLKLNRVLFVKKIEQLSGK